MMAKKKIPETQMESYLSLDQQKLSEVKQKILYVVGTASEGNANMYEIAVLMRRHYPQVKEGYYELKPRVSEMVTDGLLVRTGIKRANKMTGKSNEALALPEPIKTDKQLQYIEQQIKPVTDNIKRLSKDVTDMHVKQAKLF